MSQRSHPRIKRITTTTDWKSKGFYDEKYPQYLEEDHLIREYMNENLNDMGVAEIEIRRSPSELNIVIHSSRPGIVIGRGGEGVKKLKRGLDKVLDKKGMGSDRKIRIEVKEVKDPWSNASIAAKEMAKQLEKRMHYRRVIKHAMGKITANRNVKGARIQVAGRLNGSEIARTEHISEGNLPRETLRADLDYAFEEAYCKFGTIGVKVSIYKGEKFN
ncbi:MAG: 30S ribosomal protein S3 [Patescibacteria group bacterium]